MLGRVVKMSRKGFEKLYIFLKQITRCDTCFYIIFKGLFKSIVFRSVDLVTRKLNWLIFDFFKIKYFTVILDGGGGVKPSI